MQTPNQLAHLSDWEHKPDNSHIESTREGLGVAARLLDLERVVNEIIEHK